MTAEMENQTTVLAKLKEGLRRARIGHTTEGNFVLIPLQSNESALRKIGKEFRGITWIHDALQAVEKQVRELERIQPDEASQRKHHVELVDSNGRFIHLESKNVVMNEGNAIRIEARDIRWMPRSSWYGARDSV